MSVKKYNNLGNALKAANVMLLKGSLYTILDQDSELELLLIQCQRTSKKYELSFKSLNDFDFDLYKLTTIQYSKDQDIGTKNKTIH